MRSPILGGEEKFLEVCFFYFSVVNEIEILHQKCFVSLHVLLFFLSNKEIFQYLNHLVADEMHLSLIVVFYHHETSSSNCK